MSRIDCNDVLNFSKEFTRMCSDNKCNTCALKDDCMLSVGNIKLRHVKKVQKWSDEHPMITKLDKLRKIFPNVKCTNNDAPWFCPCDIGWGDAGDVDEEYDNCIENCKKCWEEPYDVEYEKGINNG